MGFLKDSFKESGAALDKVRPADETLEWVRDRFNILGVPILQDTERIDKGRLGIPVYVSRYSPSVSRLTGTPRQMGKGATPAQAEASAVMELVERFSLFDFVKKREHITCRRMDLEAGAVPLEDMLKALHLKDHGGEAVSKAGRLIETLTFDWVKAYCPTGGGEFRLPFSWFWPLNEYNGSASGNSFEEAAVQALSEVVERHVCSIITHEKLSTPAIELNSIKDPVARELLARFQRLNIELVLKDFSLDLGIPTVGAIAWDPSTFPSRSEIVYTAGTAPDPQRAVIRALTEVAQLAGDFDREGEYIESGLPKFSSLDEASYVLDEPFQVSVESMPNCRSENFRLEVEGLCKALADTGLKAYLVDITHPELAVPAVYAVIPGNHFRDRTRNLDVAFHCARLVDSIEHPQKALSILNTIDDLYSERYDIAFYTGHVHEQLGDYRKALKWYNRAFQLNPVPEEVASIYCHRGLCYKELEDFPKAIEELESARDSNPELKEIHNLLGYCFYRVGKHVKAIESFEQAISIDPGSAIDYANIASNLRELDMKDAAIRWYEMALELDPDLIWARDKMQELQS
ncbi:MAG: YcaO-like family protein [Deltaproteobacteria bacterium]|nr:YcaO-like family protein [Deltaproteobacteria bacterium]MDL1961993.1 YcaO-like family protein [Deltaproteobacteria bacterium]